jgi:hypothetical protein
VTVGGGGPNSATDSIGTGQVAGGNTATGSIGTVQSGPVNAGPSVVSGPTATAASTPASAAGKASPGTRTTEGAPRPNRNTLGVTKTPTAVLQTLGQLPFTGLGLLLVVVLGLALLATGLMTRARTRLSV